jgi:uncharacterized SAM-binding protein YcdF (DUF218 family)
MTYTQPLVFMLLLAGFAGLVLHRRKGVVAGLILLGLILVSWRPVELLMAKPLEGRYPIRPFHPDEAVDAIVVLSGGVNPPVFERPYAQPDAETTQRCEYAAWIYREVQAAPILACGGGGKGSKEAFSATMGKYLRRAGVPAEQIWTEQRSHSTYENALYGAEILRAHGVKRIALVVDARSMPRAEACFRKQGFTVLPAPSKIDQWGDSRDELIPTWKAIKGNEDTLHELLGFVWYRVRGWI